MAGDDDEMFMTRKSKRYAKDNRTSFEREREFYFKCNHNG